MRWITRERPKIDRIACPWLIKKFIDKDAEIIYVPFDEVLIKAAELGATPFDIPGVEFTHYDDECTFDYFIKKYKLKYDMAAQAPGLWAISAGLAYNYKNDAELLEKGMLLYDALYSWATYLVHEKHTQQPFEGLLVQVLNNFIRKQKGVEKMPAWAKEMKEIIQDQVDTNLSLNLKEISKDLNVHPSYLSREFSKYFENLSFGEYIRKLRIEKAMQLMETLAYSLTEIAYLTGFSDQSHFTRIFKKHTGKNPSQYRKSLQKK